jgi:hypothetical protein
MLNDSSLPRTYLLVDALYECTVELHVLLDIIAGKSLTTRSTVNWLVASRNRPDIEERLGPDSRRMRIGLELNPTQISRAVAAFINSKVKDLATQKKYDTGLQEEVKDQLFEKAEATFFWVALACKRLGEVPPWKTRSVLKELPYGLEPLYGRMMDQILLQNDTEDVEYCKQVLRSVTFAYRPFRLQELAAIAELPEELFDVIPSLSQLVDRCGSFLTIRQGTVYFIHQSVKDYFITGNGRKIFPSNTAEEHGKITCRSLDLMSSSLKKDMYSLKRPGALSSEAEESFSDKPLACRICLLLLGQPPC